MTDPKQTSVDYRMATPPRTGRAKTYLLIAASICGLRCFRLGERIICYLLFAICYSGLGAVAQAGDILRGNTGGNNPNPASSSFYGGNQAAMSQLQTNAHDILSRVNQALSSVQALQQAARNAAGSGNVPNGLTVGGLQMAIGKNAEWKGASLPTQSVSSGQTTVVIQQTSSQAILNWQTFNVGRHTTVDFNQSAGGSAANTWVALNRILDPSGSPSQILGSIKAQGQVYLINQNGIIFGGASQVNVSTLLAASAMITDSQFTTNGIYSTQNSKAQFLPSFTNADGTIVVQAGAQLVTNAPLGIADRGGSVILMGSAVENAGSITTANGQTVLAAGKDFFLRQGYSIAPATGVVMSSTTLGTMIGVDQGGTALNTGVIQATTGDITMAGGRVTQAGIMISTSSVDQRGTIHLLTATADRNSSVTLAPGSITYVEPDPNSGTALDPQRTSAYALSSSALAGFPASVEDYAQLPDRSGISRIEINTGGTVDFAGGSLTSATAGQIEVSAGSRIFTGNGAILDVSGLVNVSLPMSANNLAVNIQGFELRDDSLNRNTETLFNNTVYVDLRQLVEVPANSSYNAPYNTENRFYTPGGLLEVSGELNNVGHSVKEWDTIGGSITLASNQVVAQRGSVFDIAGGSVQYQAGYIKQSYVIASDGRIYNVNTAPAGIVYVGVFNGFVVNHPRWNVTETYQNVITQPAQIYQPGYTVGRDAGSLTIDAATSIFEGTIEAQTFDGPQQKTARPSASTVTDPFLLTESTVTLNGSLVVGPYTMVVGGVTQTGPLYSSNVTIENSSSSLTAGLTATSSISKSLTDINTLSANEINNANLGGLTVDVQAKPKASPSATPASIPHQGPNARGYLTIVGPLFFANGAQIALTAANAVLDGNITAPAGSVSINSQSYAAGVTSFTPAKPIIGIKLAPNVIIDTQGLWTNAFLNPLDITGEAYINGGSVTLSSDQGIALQKGSLIDASSGAAVLPNLKTLNGVGGNITVEADQLGNVTFNPAKARSLLTIAQAVSKAPLILDGTLRSYGVKAGGALTLQAYSVAIGNSILPTAPNQLVLLTSFFSQGFSSYTIHGLVSLTVAPGATVNVTEPVYQITNASFKVATGADLTSALGAPVLMPVYIGNADTATVTQRPGASLSLLSGISGQVNGTTVAQGKASIVGAGGTIDIGNGSTINVDPGQSINVEGGDQITVDGTLRAPSGNIEVVNYRSLGGVGGTGKNLSYEPGALSVWISGTLDVAARPFVALDRFGRPYGVVPNGGSIVLGSTGGTVTSGNPGDLISTDAFVIIRPGAILDASGTSAVLDLFAGANPLQNMMSPATLTVPSELMNVASNGGSISLSSYDGIYIDGSLRAASGGIGGSGGTLSISFIGPDYQTNLPFFSNLSNLSEDQLVPNNLRVQRTIVIGQASVPSSLPANLLPGQASSKLQVGHSYVSADAITQGGFDNLSLNASNSILFKGNVDLKVGESVKISAISIADTSHSAQVQVAAPYLFLGPTSGLFQINGSTLIQLTNQGGQRVQGTPELTFSADLIDLASIQFGDYEQLTETGGLTKTINYTAFRDVNFVSQGDIRFVLATPDIKTPGSFTFTAAQLYPATGTQATVEAGFITSNNVIPFVPDTSISIYRINNVDPAVPQSVFGDLTLEAQTINQGGIVRAPLGALTFGLNGTGFTHKVNFLPGSITSVSAEGLTIPYGGTTDGVSYLVNGQTFSMGLVVGTATSKAEGITLQGLSVSVANGALLDLSGGGTLFGEGFISGRGGSLDVLSTALANQNPSNTFSASGNTVYALVPGAQTYAPSVVDTNTGFTGNTPTIGQQITVPAGIPGLPPGTYTLMPSNYALLPGAFRVELGGRGNTKQPSVLSLDNGSYEANVNAGVANTSIESALPIEAIITPASTVETYAQYDLETYNAVAISQAQKFNQPRPLLPIDASTLTLNLTTPLHRVSQLSFDGTADFSPAAGGYSGNLVILGAPASSATSNFQIEITGPNSTPTQGWISLSASAVDAIGAPNVFIGGVLQSGGGLLVQFDGRASAVTIRTGAVLTGADVTLMTENPSSSVTGQITVESGASIDTLGYGAPAIDSTSGYYFTNSILSQTFAVLAVSNGYLNIQPAAGSTSGPITVDNRASLFSDGTIAFATNNGLNLGENVNYGAKYIGFSSTDINIGTPAALAAAKRAGTLPNGILLNQILLDRLLAGDPAVGAPALQILTLSAAQSINFYGSINLNTINSATGKSSLQAFVLDTPAVYGAGSGSDTATITTGTLVWNGLAQLQLQSGVGTTYLDTPAGPVIANGPGTGSGTLNIVANEILFGYSPTDQPQNLASLGRLVLGFSAVNLTANQEITANSQGSFSVYQTQTGPGTYTGGNLNLVTPLLTGAPGSVLSYKAGGTLTLTAPVGVLPVTVMSDSLGAEINLTGNTINDSTSILAASGKVTLTAAGNINLNANSRIDVSGLTVSMFDQKVPTFGGDVSLESTQGNIIQAVSSMINVSAIGADAGSLTITATGTSGGVVTLGGTVLGSSTGDFNAGAFEVRAQNVGDFTLLNHLLDTGGFYYSRSFDIKQGNIIIAAGTTIKAETVDISVDNGSLTISGTIDASGTIPGTIRLSSSGNLELTSTGILDVHSTVLQVDSYGQPIDAENRGTIELTVADGNNSSSTNLNNGQGSLLLDPGATINMSSPDGVARGDLELNVPRTAVTSGDIRIQAVGPLTITGAQTIAVNAFWTYAPADGIITQTNLNSSGTPIDPNGIGLDQVNNDSKSFIQNALTNGQLKAELAGLTAYTQAFHLRPGVEIVSATPNGDLTVEGDLDLSVFRYPSLNPNSQQNSTYGSGEPGVLVLRAGGNLNVYGSINDGFGTSTPTANPDQNGWILTAGTTSYNVVVNTTAITLATGTTFPNNAVTLSYPIPIGSTTLNQSVAIPATVTLGIAQTVTTAFVATATITIPGGQTFHAGQTVPANTVLQIGTIFSSGSVLPFTITIQPMSWPAGASLAVFSAPVSLTSSVPLTPGDLIPGGANLVFPNGVTSVNTRPVNGGIQGQVYALEPLLSLGPNDQIPLSWSFRLVAGADTAAADTRILQPQTALNGSGNLVLDDPHITIEGGTPIFSVIRTGTGYLDLLAGGNFTEQSLYGIYTAGAPTPNITDSNGGSFNLQRGELGDGTILGKQFIQGQYAVYETVATTGYQAYYPNGGGNVLVSAQGDLTGFNLNSLSNANFNITYSIANWLWTQGGTAIGQNAAWWVNFGTYVPGPNTTAPVVAGFTGIGALGGGNVAVESGGNGGVTTPSSDQASSTSLVIAVAATGRVTSVNNSGAGSLVETGGGDVTIKIGEALNPIATGFGGVVNDTGFQGGEFTDIRGKLNIEAGSIGGIDLVYGQSSALDPRPTDVSTSTTFSFAFGGPALAPGDATINLQVRGDAVLGNAVDPGIISSVLNTTNAAVTSNPSQKGNGQSFFTLWTPETAIDLISAGGNIVPAAGSGVDFGTPGLFFPSTLRLFTTSGSVYTGNANPGVALELTPSSTGDLEVLAEKSIYADALIGGNPVSFEISGAPSGPTNLPNPFDAAFELLNQKSGNVIATNTLSSGSSLGTFGLFGFELDSASGTLHKNDPTVAHIYATNGDIVGLQFGTLSTGMIGNQSFVTYVAAKAVSIRAGGDIVNFGEFGSPSLILNNSTTDVSVISAGNEILFANVDIAGPGNLELSAGGNIYQGAQGVIESIGLVGTPKLINPDGGASIIVLAGVGANGPNWTGFADLYLNPANLADPNQLLVNQPGKVDATYEDQLLSWLQSQYAFKGTTTEALTYFESLPVAQQNVFLLQVYLSELNESGLEYNDPTSRFFHTYIRGDEAIAALFPITGANGQKITYNGGLTMFSGVKPGTSTITDSSILTDFGGSITTVVAGGQTVVGVTGVTPGAHSGILTQGSGNIDMYSEGSVLLGESRVLTTFGGNIVIWSAGGDINAGIGAKGTVIFAPPGIVYDDYSDIVLAPTVPSSGAGIGTLAPIPDVPPGNVDLVAPEGTIDAGEAGIRASGNANLAARVIINAANITVAGKTTGIPTVVSPNVTAITAANNTFGASNSAASDLAKQQAAANQEQQAADSVIIVEVLGYGGGDDNSSSTQPSPSSAQPSPNPAQR